MHGCIVPPHNLHRSTFSFSESRTAFSFADKRKSGFGPCWAGKNQLQGKNTPLSCKRKGSFPRKGHAPSIRRHSTHRVRAVSKRHSRQETACRQRPGCGLRRAGKVRPRKDNIVRQKAQRPQPYPSRTRGPTLPCGRYFYPGTPALKKIVAYFPVL